MKFALLGFEFAWDPLLFISSFLPLEWKYLSYTSSPTVFYKHIIFLLSQAHSWRGILLGMNHHICGHMF